MDKSRHFAVARCLFSAIKGLEYLQDNKMMKKASEIAKGIVDTGI